MAVPQLKGTLDAMQNTIKSMNKNTIKNAVNSEQWRYDGNEAGGKSAAFFFWKGLVVGYKSFLNEQLWMLTSVNF
ncbi:hypothetical protein [Bacillus mycoides]|uniref:hypothetical protein n=1 Tax=Bacillus mycoides TaxID=1405 RepID=UPI003D207C21